jgi:hypothetical protein
MRRIATVLLVTALLSLAAATSPALEKVARPASDAEHDGWETGTTYSIAYYNTCTGWIWNWTGWSPNDRVGVVFTGIYAPLGILGANWLRFGTGSPSGYGFTGTVDLFYPDASGCPAGASFASQAFLPATGWNLVAWGGVVVGSTSFVVALTFGPGQGNPTGLSSDHPAAGPTGPPACGTCYPTTRPRHSWYWGTAASPLCPGSGLNDGVCDAELLLDAGFVSPYSVQRESWGQIKSLYR